MGVCQKRPICVQSEVILVTNVCPPPWQRENGNPKPLNVSATRFRIRQCRLRTMFRGLWHHQRSEWVQPLLKTQPFHLQSRPHRKKNSQSSLLYLLVWTYIFFKGYGSLPKKADLCPIWGRFGHKMCAPGENINPKPLQVTVTRFLDMAMWFRTILGGILASSKAPGRYMLWLKTQLLILQVYPLKNKSKLRSSTLQFWAWGHFGHNMFARNFDIKELTRPSNCQASRWRYISQFNTVVLGMVWWLIANWIYMEVVPERLLDSHCSIHFTWT